MGKIAVITDSNAGFSVEEAKEKGIMVVPMPFYINEKVYYENIDLDQKGFYKMLEDDSIDIKTSMPTTGDVIDLWKKTLESYDEIVYIPMSSGLSSSCETAMMLSEDFDGKVQVVNNQRISITQKLSVYDALTMVEKGANAAEIKKYLEETAFESTIYIMVDTLKYLKKGGRITPAAAALGTLLKLKPVLQIQGEKLDAFSKARTVKLAKQIMLDSIHTDITNRFGDDPANVNICAAYTEDDEAAAEWLAEIKEEFPNNDVFIDPLSLSVSCHIGPSAIAIAATRIFHG